MTCHALLGLAAATSSVALLDFQDAAQIGQLRVSEQTKIEPVEEAHEGKRAARVMFAPVPEGVRDYPAFVIEGSALKVRDFSPFEAVSLWVKNTGADEAELSIAVWDKDGHRSFPIPSTITVKPGRWEQIVARLVLQGLDTKQIGSVHFYQKSNRQPVTLLLADVQLLSPSAGRFAAQIQGTRQALNSILGSATTIGAKEQVEAQIAKLTPGLDKLESTAGGNTAADKTERLLELARISTAAQELANSIKIMNGGRRIVMSGPLVEPSWLSHLDQVPTFAIFILSGTSLGDEIFPHLAPAKNLEALLLDSSRKVTGRGPRAAMGGDPSVGLRTRLAPSPGLMHALDRVIELHLFDHGYAGLLLLEDGSANLCLSVARSRLTAAGGVTGLIADLGRDAPRLIERIGQASAGAAWQAIGAVPYGWRATDTRPGLFRLGDQAAVIASLAGDGVAIALASGRTAATAYLRDGPAGAALYQRHFARAAHRPLIIANTLRHLAERPTSAARIVPLLARMPALAAWLARLTRIAG